MKRREIIILNVIATIVFIVGIFEICMILGLLNSVANLVDPIWIILLVCYVTYKFMTFDLK